VRSMLNFHRVAGTQLVRNEEEAYRYWLRSVRACVKAEQACGPNVVRRIRYRDLVDDPESTMRSLLDFISEPYAARCLEPLVQRINSSNVSGDFKTDDSASDPAVVAEATQLSRELEGTAQPADASRTAADEMEAAFVQRTQYMATLENRYRRSLQSSENSRRQERHGVPSYERP